MGGRGSGGHNRLDDDEKRRRGTFRKDMSEEVFDKRAAEKVIAGPWLKEIPDPVLPLNSHGRKQYDELCRELFTQNKLTGVTVRIVEQYAVLFQDMQRRLVAEEPIPASLSDKMQRALAALKIAEDAPTISNPEGKRNRFAGAGFSNRRNAAVRLLTSAEARSRK